MLQYLTLPNVLGGLGLALAIGLVLLGGYLRNKYPRYPTRFIRCNGCLDPYFVPAWEAEGFRCPKCRDGK
jgi:hypothetical protein